jgi:hypothetical protein
VQGKSGCRKIDDTNFEYTHCSGYTHVYTQNCQTCLESDVCPGAFYIGIIAQCN